MHLRRFYISVIICYLLIVLFPAGLSGQVITAKAVLDTNRFLIGDQMKMKLMVEMPSDVTVTFPDIGDKLTEKIDVIAKSDIDSTIALDGLQKLNQELVIAVFDTGYFEVPSMTFIFHFEGITDTIETLPKNVEIMSLALDDDIRDLKANYKAPVSLGELYPYIVALIFISLAVWFIRNYYRKKYGKIPVTLTDPKLDPPNIFALKEIEKLKDAAPWMHNRIKYYYIRLSDIIRNYLEQQFQIAALEQTTEEIIFSMRNTPCNESCIDMLTRLLALADWVKFAKVIPDEKENESQIETAIQFVKSSYSCIMTEEKVADEKQPELINEEIE